MAKIQLIREASISNPYIPWYGVYIDGSYRDGAWTQGEALNIYDAIVAEAKSGEEPIEDELIREDEV